jgi:hypothetical protein
MVGLPGTVSEERKGQKVVKQVSKVKSRPKLVKKSGGFSTTNKNRIGAAKQSDKKSPIDTSKGKGNC